jgi:hypothetical protein
LAIIANRQKRVATSNGKFCGKHYRRFLVFQLNARGEDATNVENIGTAVIQQLLDEINELERNLGKNADMPTDKWNKTRIETIRTTLIRDAGKVEANRWLQLRHEKQQEYIDSLEAIRIKLLDASRTSNARQSKDLLEDAGEFNQSMIWLVIFGVIFVATLLSLIR